MKNKPSKDLEAVLRQAAALLQAGQVRQAAALCEQLLKQAPGQPDALHLLALASAAQGDHHGAEKHYLDSLARAPQRPDILVNFGKFLRGSGRIPEAEQRLQQALGCAPQFAPALQQLGLLQLGSGQLDSARGNAQQLTRLEPDNPAGWELLAAIEQKRSDPVAAIAACREGLRRQPQAGRLHYSLAQLLRQESDFSAAVTSYQAALDCGLETPDLYRNLAEALLDAGQIERAMGCATAGIERFQDHAMLHRTRARLHWESGAAGDPVDLLWKAARQQPANAELWTTLVQLLERLGRADDCSAALGEAQQLGCPQTADILLLEAMSVATGGDPLRATELYANLLQAHPQQADIALTFAGHLLSQGDPERAEALCAKVLEADSHNQLAWCYRGTAWQLLGDPRESWLLDYQHMVKPVQVPAPDGYASREAFFREVQLALESLHQTQAHPIEQSLRGGTQTNGFLFRLKHPLIAVLEKQILLAIGSALETFPDDTLDDTTHPFWGRRTQASAEGVQFAGAWSVRLRSEGFHTNHIHTEGWISSALYIALPDEVRDESDHSGSIQFGVPMSELGLSLPSQRTIRPEVGTLVLFPSYMWHGTVPFTSQQPRITVAFDLLPKI